MPRGFSFTSEEPSVNSPPTVTDHEIDRERGLIRILRHVVERRLRHIGVPVLVEVADEGG